MTDPQITPVTMNQPAAAPAPVAVPTPEVKPVTLPPATGFKAQQPAQKPKEEPTPPSQVVEDLIVFLNEYEETLDARRPVSIEKGAALQSRLKNQMLAALNHLEDGKEMWNVILKRFLACSKDQVSNSPFHVNNISRFLSAKRFQTERMDTFGYMITLCLGTCDPATRPQAVTHFDFTNLRNRLSAQQFDMLLRIYDR